MALSWTAFLLIYVLGGITFLPLVLAAVVLHAYYTLPYRPDVDPARKSSDGTTSGGSSNGSSSDSRNSSSNNSSSSNNGNSQHGNVQSDDIVQPGDSIDALADERAKRKDESRARASHVRPDRDVAGYFAVCREYTPMGINAKPIERATPVGSATVAAPSPSVYQTMYRSIFDRKSAAGPLDSKNNMSQRPKRAGNVFYVVLRHGHLMLFDDDEQLEVRHVVSLIHHAVSIYSGEDMLPEGELYIKRNAICLSRRTESAETGPDGQPSKPFYLFSENCSAKEDFYFALLRNQEEVLAAESHDLPSPIHFDVKNIISLVQKLHSNDEHIHTRWLNALIGRVFLGIHKTKDVENLIREKLSKKISRVKRPSFLSNIAIEEIDTGDSAPYITNVRLRDLAVEGDCCVEADLRYTGNFRIQVAATARLDLGSRFKAREVNLVLAVVLRKLEGHFLVKIKAPPSNRLWFSFSQTPKMEMTIEPIVSSRQITYTVILRQIENRIKEVVAETLVLPFWDDMPFLNTEHKRWRGGIFYDDVVASASAAAPTSGGATKEPNLVEATQEGNVRGPARSEEAQGGQENELTPVEKSHSMPMLEVSDHDDSNDSTQKAALGLFGRRLSKNSKQMGPVSSPSASTTSLDGRGEAKSENTATRPAARSTSSYMQPLAPTVGTDVTHADVFRPSSSPPSANSAASAMAMMAARSQTASPSSQGLGSPAVPPAFKPYVTSKSHASSASSREALDPDKEPEGQMKSEHPKPPARQNSSSSLDSQQHDHVAPCSPTLTHKSSLQSLGSSGSKAIAGVFGRRDSQTSSSARPPSSPGSQQEALKRTALAAVTSAAVSAKRWGLNALQRQREVATAKSHSRSTSSQHGSSHDLPLDLSLPIGRGRPLPPPGVPLPMPDKYTKTAPMPVPKRKPVPAPLMQDLRPEDKDPPPRLPRWPMLSPPLPPRRTGSRQYESEQPCGSQGDDADAEGMLVVAAPDDSEPTTPLGTDEPAGSSGSIKPWAEVEGDGGGNMMEPDQPSSTASSTASSLRSKKDTKTSPEHDRPGDGQGATSGGKRWNTAPPVDDDDDEYEAWMDNTGTGEEGGPARAAVHGPPAASEGIEGMEA